jgi:hypothetical protein
MVENIFVESPVNKRFNIVLPASQRITFIANLTLGQLVEGKVMRLLSNHTYLINFMGFKVVAESMISLTPGQQIQVRVVQTNPQVVMSLVTEMVPEQKALSLIRSYLPLQIHWGGLIESLSEVLTDKGLYLLEMVVDREVLGKVISCLSSLSFGTDKMVDSRNIKQFIENSGLFYESKLKQSLFLEESLPKQLMKIAEKDFKGLLLSLSQKLEDASGRLDEGRDVISSGKVGNMLRMVNSSIKRIELHQLVNYLTTRNDQQLVFQIPLILPEGIKTAQLYIRYGHQRGKKRGVKQDDFYIVFLLNMKSLGDLRIDTHFFKKRISCKIQVGNKETANFVKKNLSKLSQQLESSDYKVEKLDCIVSNGEDVKKEAPLQGFSLLKMRLLDIVV